MRLCWQGYAEREMTMDDYIFQVAFETGRRVIDPYPQVLPLLLCGNPEERIARIDDFLKGEVENCLEGQLATTRAHAFARYPTDSNLFGAEWVTLSVAQLPHSAITSVLARRMPKVNALDALSIALRLWGGYAGAAKSVAYETNTGVSLPDDRRRQIGLVHGWAQRDEVFKAGVSAGPFANRRKGQRVIYDGIEKRFQEEYFWQDILKYPDSDGIDPDLKAEAKRAGMSCTT